jgi:acyl-CoA thioester hydrolase
MKVHAIDQAVRYVETDRMKVVHHSTYLSWFEVGRTSLLSAAGFPYHSLEASGVLFPVVEYSCRMIGSADYGDTVRIESSIDSLRSRIVVFTYRALNRGELIATGITKHICAGADLKPRRFPDALREALEAYVHIKSEAQTR